ncbi:MAG: SRPBCC family protein [Chloroflexota bacterium]|nr:SRPBCC family protein [Chloroflexota bacterium]MDP9469188.1 SRPBCC family protein [Chloroflexota bacterium]
MHTENVIEMRGDLDRIVALAADIERWPEILPHYRWVTLLEGGGDRKVVEMAARRDRLPVKWRAVQEIHRDGPTPVISYRHIAGVVKGMVVDWTFDPLPDRVVVRIRHDFSPPWPLIGGFLADRVIGPQFIGNIAGKTLTTIKSIVETEYSSGNDGASD